MRIITVSREFGSGGRELGQCLAKLLGAAYYDREIISEIAKKGALDETYVERALERERFRDHRLTAGRSFAYIPERGQHDAQALLLEQQRVVRKLAGHGDCVVVGRNGDILLGGYDPFKLFVYAELEEKVERCRKRGTDGEALERRELEKKIRQIDKARANYHAMLSGLPWGDRRGYHLCVNTTGMEIQDLAPVLAQYIRTWFDGKKGMPG